MQSLLDKQKYILAVFVAILVVAGGVFYRSEISELLDLGGGKTSPASSVSEEEIKAVEKEENAAIGPAENIGVIEEIKVPPYTGRDPGEVRPVPEEVKLFTEAQRQQIYDTIRTHARAVRENPYFFNGWMQIGILKKTIGDFEGARDAWEYAGIIEPMNSLSFANLGELYWRYLHEYPKSEAAFRTAIEHKPDDGLIYVSLAELYHYSYQEKHDQAPAVLLEGLSVKPDNETLMRRLAYLYEQRGELANALEWWKKVDVSFPGDEEVVAKIKKLEEKLAGGS